MASIKTQVENAIEFAELGWHVFPVHYPAQGGLCSCGQSCSQIGKHPIPWNGLLQATTNREEILKWWRDWPDANIGIVTGGISGIVALDIDPAHGGRESIGKLMADHGDLPETLEVSTGGGGDHLYFRWPNQKIKNSSGENGWIGKPGVDFRGDGGYVIAPCSYHRSGKMYEFKSDPASTVIAEMPAWLITLHNATRERAVASTNATERTDDDTARMWLGKALAKSAVGARNATGLWLACQLRDSGLTENSAAKTMRDYAQRVPQGSDVYDEREALASLKSAYATAPRTSATSGKSKQAKPVGTPESHTETEITAATELREHFGAIIDGRIYDARFPWQYTTNLTQALLNGSITVLCGDPGVGKTFAALQCLKYWHANGIDAVAFFVEKDRKFHTLRLIAQLEGNGNFCDYEWVKTHSAEVNAAMDRHEDFINILAPMIYSSPVDRVTLDSLLEWIRQQAKAGKRVILVDPFTAIAAGDARWEADENFMIGCSKVVTEFGCSLLLITHGKKGNRTAAPSGQDIAGGAALYRFCDTAIWMNKLEKPKSVMVRTSVGQCMMMIDLFFRFLKTRLGRGHGQMAAFRFGHALEFAEQGMLVPEEKGGEDVSPH